ncbi:MMPL family transporter, partial [bacterium]|nr:MMPL family transporter [bacterium]
MKYIYRYPLLILVLVLGITGFLGWQIPRMTIDNSLRNFLMDKHPAKQKSRKLESSYGNNEVIMIIMRVEGDTIFSLDTMHKLDQVTRVIENIPYVENVTSLMNTDYMEGMEGGIAVGKIVPHLPATEEDLLKIKARLFSWDLYQGFLYSDDLKATQIIVTLVTETMQTIEVKDENGKNIKQMQMMPTSGDEEKQAFAEIQETLKRFEDERTSFHVVGNEAVSMLVSQGIKDDMLRLVPFVLVATLIILYFAFRNISGVLLTTLTVVVSCIWTMGLMPLCQVDFAVMSSAIPVLLVAIGSAYGIHLISHYYDELAAYTCEHQEVGKTENRQIVYGTLRKIGVPIFLTGITTMAGFGSLMSSSILMVRNFGLFTAIGVAMALLATLILIPALLLMQKHPLRHMGVKPATGRETWATQMLMGVYHFFTKRAVRVIVLALVVVVLAVVGIQKIIIGEEIINYFKPNTDIRQADKYSNEHFNGSTIMYLHVEGREEEVVAEDDFTVAAETQTVGDDDFAVEDDFTTLDEPVASAPKQEKQTVVLKSLKEPDILKAMDDMGKYLKHKYPEVKQVLSFADMVKRMNKVMHVDEDEAAAQEKVTNQERSGIRQPSLRRTESRDLSGEELVEAVSKERDHKAEAFNEIPYDPAKYGKKDKAGLRRLISQYLVLYSGNLDDFINNMDNPTSAKMTVQMN